MKRQYVILVVLGMLTGCASTVEERNANLPKYVDSTVEIEKRAENYYKEANLDLAESEYLRLMEMVPEYAAGWFRLGNIYLRKNNLDAAIRNYQKAIKFDPQMNKAWHNLAVARVRQATLTLVDSKRVLDSKKTAEIDLLLKKLLELQRNN